MRLNKAAAFYKNDGESIGTTEEILQATALALKNSLFEEDPLCLL